MTSLRNAFGISDVEFDSSSFNLTFEVRLALVGHNLEGSHQEIKPIATSAVTTQTSRSVCGPPT